MEQTEKNIINAANNIRGDRLEKSCNKERCGGCYMNHVCLTNDKKKEYNIKK